MSLRLRVSLCCILLALTVASHATTYYTVVRASQIGTDSGSADLLTSGLLCFTAVNPMTSQPLPQAFNAGGVGLRIGRPTCYPVTNGAVSPNSGEIAVQVPDSNYTFPQYVGYLITVTDSTGAGYTIGTTQISCTISPTPTNCSGGVWSLDSYQPNFAALAIVQTGPPGPPGVVDSWTGAWSSTTGYNIGDVVGYLGASYVSLIACNVGNQPNISPSDWAQIAGVGPAGPQGIQGAQGIQGIQGIQGLTGAMIDSGTGAPSSGVGNNGDWYIRTSNYCLYGPKASGSWPGTCQLMVSAIPTTVLKKGDGVTNLTCSSTSSWCIVDPTHLAYTVTIPTGWTLLISASGSAVNGTTGSNGYSIGLLDGATALVATPLYAGTNSYEMAFSLHWAITGDGASHTISLGAIGTSGSASTNISIANSAAFGYPQIPSMTFFLTPSN